MAPLILIAEKDGFGVQTPTCLVTGLREQGRIIVVKGVRSECTVLDPCDRMSSNTEQDRSVALDIL